MENKLDLPPGDTVADALGAMSRACRHAKLRCLVAKRRWERSPSKETEHNYMLTAQEYYYVAKLRHDFQEAAMKTLAARHAEVSEKKGSVN